MNDPSSRTSLTSPMSPAQTLVAIQAAVAAHRGELGAVSDTRCTFVLPPAGPQETLKNAGVVDADGRMVPGQAVPFEVELFASGVGTEVRLAASSNQYFAIYFGIPASTLDSFVSTLRGSLASSTGGRRPPDRPPPNR